MKNNHEENIKVNSSYAIEIWVCRKSKGDITFFDLAPGSSSRLLEKISRRLESPQWILKRSSQNMEKITADAEEGGAEVELLKAFEMSSLCVVWRH